MENKKDVGQVFRDGFRNFEAPPPERVWDNVSTRIRGGTPPSGFHLPAYVYMIASLLLVTGLVLGYLYIDAPQTTEVPAGISVQAPAVLPEPIPANEPGNTLAEQENPILPKATPEPLVSGSTNPNPSSLAPIPQKQMARPTPDLPQTVEIPVAENQLLSQNNRETASNPDQLSISPKPEQTEVIIDTPVVEQAVSEVIIHHHEISVCRGEEVVLNAGDGSQYQWNQGGFGQSFTLTAEENRQILVDYISHDGQAARQIFDVRILDCSVFIPKAFSPNDDGYNDVFRVRAEGISQFDMKIFSKWGEMVFHTRNAENGWDGRIRGIRAPAGIYIYQINYNDPNQNTRAIFGTLTLLP